MRGFSTKKSRTSQHQMVHSNRRTALKQTGFTMQSMVLSQWGRHLHCLGISANRWALEHTNTARAFAELLPTLVLRLWPPTCSCVCIMATAATTASPSTSISAKKSGKKAIVIAALLVLLVGVNAGYWFYRNKAHGTSVSRAAATAAPAAVELETVTLDPFIVNLADGQGYLKVGITLAVHKAETGSKRASAEGGERPTDTAHSAAVRDAILTTLMGETTASLMTMDGKNALKAKLKTDLQSKVPTLALQNVFFTDFLIQQ